jgi:hypothetical protein
MCILRVAPFRNEVALESSDVFLERLPFGRSDLRRARIDREQAGSGQFFLVLLLLLELDRQCASRDSVYVLPRLAL